MHLDIHRCCLIVVGCLIRFGLALECLQCTSPIRRVSRNWDHSCLDGTLAPVSCPSLVNQSETPFQQCMSAVHRLGNRRSAGVLIYRGCMKTAIMQQECDPPNSTIDVEKTLGFYCSLTCFGDGCNRHTVKEITSAAHDPVVQKYLVLSCICFLCALCFRNSGFS